MTTTYSGMLKKMRTSADENNTVHYSLPIGDELVDINSLIGKEVTVTYSGEINCVHCNRKTKKSFNQGYCYPCLISLAQCDSCIIKPEKCHYHEGTCREPQWGEEHCFSEHFVYLANTGTVLCKDHIADKTNWRTMLKGKPDEVDLEQVKTELMSKIESELEALKQEKGLQAVSEVTTPIHDIHYPVEDYPVKIKSLNLDKTPSFSGVLQGIKGQYWMLDGDRVINIRKFAGYNVDLSF